MDQCPLSDTYVTMFGNSSDLSAVATATITGREILPGCNITLTADLGSIDNGAPLTNTCTGQSSCALSISANRHASRLSSDVSISIDVTTDGCCLSDGSGSDSTTLLVRNDPPRRLYKFLGAGGGDPLQYIGTPPGIDEVTTYASDNRGTAGTIAGFATTEWMGSSSSEADCKRYPEINILGYSNGGHNALYTTKHLAEDHHVTVARLYVIDPVPWNDCSLHGGRCYFASRQCVNAFNGAYQQVHTNGINWTQRGRTVGGGTTQLTTGPACNGGAGVFWPDNAHTAILCHPTVSNAINTMFADGITLVRDDYECLDGPPQSELVDGHGLLNCAYAFGLGVAAPCYTPLN